MESSITAGVFGSRHVCHEKMGNVKFGNGDTDSDYIVGGNPSAYKRDTLATLEGVTLHASAMLPVKCSLANFNCKADVRVWTGKLPGADGDSVALGSAIVRRIGDLAGISLATNPGAFVSRKGLRTDANPTGIAGAVLLPVRK